MLRNCVVWNVLGVVDWITRSPLELFERVGFVWLGHVLALPFLIDGAVMDYDLSVVVLPCEFPVNHPQIGKLTLVLIDQVVNE